MYHQILNLSFLVGSDTKKIEQIKHASPYIQEQIDNMVKAFADWFPESPILSVQLISEYDNTKQLH